MPFSWWHCGSLAGLQVPGLLSTQCGRERASEGLVQACCSRRGVHAHSSHPHPPRAPESSRHSHGLCKHPEPLGGAARPQPSAPSWPAPARVVESQDFPDGLPWTRLSPPLGFLKGRPGQELCDGDLRVWWLSWLGPGLLTAVWSSEGDPGGHQHVLTKVPCGFLGGHLLRLLQTS